MSRTGQGSRRACRAGPDDRGYVMVVLLIGIAVSAVWMGALLPAWRQQTQRDKEADLIFRGEAYARAIALFFVKNQALPPTLDVLVQQRYLRRRYTDPITGKDFIPVGGAPLVSAPGPAGGRGQAGVTPPATPGLAGIFGVRSTSTAASIIVYQGQTTHSQFPFDYQVALQRMGARGGGTSLIPPGPRGGAPGRGGELAPVIPGRAGRGLGVGGPARRGGPVPNGFPPAGVFGPQAPPADAARGRAVGGPD